MTNISSNLTAIAMAQRHSFDPWSLPDDFTVFDLAPENVRTFLHPHWKTQQAVHPLWSYFFGLYYFVMGTVAIGGNSMVLKIFSRYPTLRTPSNMLVINLAVSDLLLMLTLIPEACFNFFTGGPWRFGELGCQIHAFSGALLGYSQITTLVLISLDRYKVIVSGFSAAPLTYSKVSGYILFNWIWSLGWSLCPLLGWGHYALDGMLGTCSFDAYTTTMNHKSHILASCIFLYFLPIVIIFDCYYFIVQAVFKHEEELRVQAKKMNVASLRASSEQQQVSAEIRAAKVAVVNVTLWIFAWTPFALVCMLGTWNDPGFVTPLISELPVLCAKTSAVYNPIIYALSHPKYRECLKEMFPWLCIVLNGKNVIKDSSSKDAESESSVTIETGDHKCTDSSTISA